MQCSVDLPTTVDFGNNLVNYIEVSADDLPRDPTVSTETPATAVVNEKTQSTPTQSESKAVIEEKTKSAKPAPKTRPALVAGHYSSQIPQYLIDLDKAEESAAYKYAAGAIVQLPTPPSLPGFLGKPILNAATPMKDDNSVLNMPNHTVLNHLATSSIKNNVLAVSATTRYKRKVSDFSLLIVMHILMNSCSMSQQSCINQRVMISQVFGGSAWGEGGEMKCAEPSI